MGNNLRQRFSNHGLRTTCDPRGSLLWSFKNEEKIEFKLNAYHTIAENLKTLEMTHDNRLSLYKGDIR